MRNRLSLLTVGCLAMSGALYLGCGPGEGPPTATSSSSTSAATNMVAFNVEGMH